ncbi:MAG: hypothetical protein ABSE90_13675, partial [Verrucomicrobiota bacterium]
MADILTAQKIINGTSNNQHPTPNIQLLGFHWLLVVGCSMLDVFHFLPSPNRHTVVTQMKLCDD